MSNFPNIMLSARLSIPVCPSDTGEISLRQNVSQMREILQLHIIKNTYIYCICLLVLTRHALKVSEKIL
jgi:hypothetical protein